MQADFLLFLRGSVGGSKSKARQWWWPDTLLYAGRLNGPFEIFARSQSASYFERIAPMLGVTSKSELQEVISKMGHGSNAELYIPRWQHNAPSVVELSNIERIATMP
jgi:hypothetical protein